MASVVFVFLQAGMFLIVSKHIGVLQLGYYFFSSALIGIALTIVGSSFTYSLIHRDSITAQDYQAVLTLNTLLASGLFTIVIIIGFAGIVFNVHEEIAYICLCLAPLLFFEAYVSVEITGLKRELLFKKVALIEILSSIDYILTVLLFLWLGFDYWSLVLGLLVKYFSSFVFIKILSPGYFRVKFVKISETQDHWDYGKFILGERLLSTLLGSADVLIIGTVLGYANLGVYDVLKRIVLRPVLIIYNGIENVIFPLLSKAKSEKFLFNKVYSAHNFISKYIFIAFFILVYINSKTILTFFPEAYNGFLSEFQFLCIFGAVIIILNPIDILLYSLGRTKEFLYWIMAYFLPLFIISFWAATFGLKELLGASIIFYLILYVISYGLLIKDTIIGFKNYFESLNFSIMLFGSVILITSYLDVYNLPMQMLEIF